MNKLVNKYKDNQDLASQVQMEYQVGYNYINIKREQRRWDLKRLITGDRNDSKINIHALNKMHNTLMSITYQNYIKVGFISRTGWAKAVAENITKVSESDYDLMGKKYVDRNVEWNKYTYGVGVYRIAWWDDEEKIPLIENIDPLACIPDPQEDTMTCTGNGRRFFWFTRRVSKYDLTEDNWYYNTDSISYTTTSEIRENDDSRYNARGYTNTDSTLEDVADIYFHYTRFDSKLFMTAWANDRSKLIKIVELEPKNKKEEANPMLIKIPVFCKRMEPFPWDWFWVSIIDKGVDYQIQLSTLINLQLIKARRDSLNEDLLVDVDQVDINAFKTNKPWGRLIPYNRKGQSQINQAVYPVPSAPSNPTTDKMIVDLERKLFEELPAQTQWVAQPWSQTATETTTLQLNVNQLLRYSLENSIDAEEAFWEEWYKQYQYNFYGKKLIILTANYLQIEDEYTKRDFVTEDKMLIKVQSILDINADREKRYQQLVVSAWLVLEDPNASTYTKNEYKRALLETQWQPREMVMVFVPYTPEEAQAMLDLELLNDNIEIAEPDGTEDFLTRLDIYSKAKDTSAKRKALQKYMQAYIASGNVQTPWQAGWQIDNALQNQITAQMLAGWWANQVSNLNVTQ